MKISSRALAYISILAGASSAAAQKCLSGSFILEYEGDCNRETLVEVFDDQVFSPAKNPACEGVTAEAELDAQLAAAVPSTTIEELCASIYNSQPEVPFTDILKKNENMTYEKAFFLGHSTLQEEVETTYETKDGSATSVLKEDGELVRAHFQGSAQSRKTEWPQLPNFASSATDSNGNPTCTTSAAMCCWTKDRQAADNNGNCNRNTYSENCVDKNPGDNTDLCFVDLERGEASTGNQQSGIVGFPGDQDGDGGEGAIHCHGLAWANDVTDSSARYKGNNLFFVSMYDHMYQRGYVENVPGAPMCGCVEQMPTVTRSDCTEIDATERFKITYDSSANTVEGSITLADINFNACQGINNRNNDLWAYMGRLYYEGKIENTQWGEAGRIITNSNCDFAVEEALSKQALEPGYDYDISQWTNVAGRDNFNVNESNPTNLLQVATFGAEALRLALTTHSANLDKAPHGIIKRMCSTCDPDFKEIYYRRLTAIPDGYDLLHNILYQRNDGGGNNRWNEDFSLHSTYEDAVNNVNAWLCPNNSFNYGASFYGECSPSGERVRDQYSVFTWSPGPRAHVGYYIAKGEDEGFVKVDTHAIRGRDYANGMAVQSADGKTIIMTGHGRDIWSNNDDFNFKADDIIDNDFTAVVKVGSRNTASPQPWSKVGLMVRTSLDANSAHFSVFRTGSNGICTQGRRTAGDWSKSFGNCIQTDAPWVKIEKRMDVYTSFFGTEGVDGEITWTEVKSEVLPDIGDSSYVGLAVSSASYYQLETVFEDFEVSQYFFPSAAPSISLAPTMDAPFTDINAQDLGRVTQSSAGSWDVAGAGHDIWGTSDSFRFVNFTMSGDVAIEMKVNSFEGDPAHNGYLYSWAKGGVMIRDTMDANSRHFSMFVTGGNGLANQWRDCTGCHSGHSKTHNDNPRPVWLQVKKVSNVFTTAFKYDVEGAEWIQFGATRTMDFGSEFSVGIAVTSHDWNKIATLRGSDFSILDATPVTVRKLRA